jgi:hypothetical protein
MVKNDPKENSPFAWLLVDCGFPIRIDLRANDASEECLQVVKFSIIAPLLTA